METPKSLTLVGDGAVHSLAAVGAARWLKFKPDTNNGADCLVGAGEVTSTVGFPLTKGQITDYWPNGVEQYGFYDLPSVKYYLAANDKLYVLYGG